MQKNWHPCKVIQESKQTTNNNLRTSQTPGTRPRRYHTKEGKGNSRQSVVVPTAWDTELYNCKGNSALSKGLQEANAVKRLTHGHKEKI
ncbi:hypothetical protein Tco_0198780 [Tanacetum coccineum]